MSTVFDEKELRQIERELRESLLESRFAVEDFFPIKRQLHELSRQLQTFPTRDLEEKRAIEETIDLLRWLLADHFIFLGYRDYRYFERDGKPHIQVVAKSGLGVLRDDTTSSVASRQDSLSST